jgi:hypothetical protein
MARFTRNVGGTFAIAFGSSRASWACGERMEAIFADATGGGAISPRIDGISQCNILLHPTGIAIRKIQVEHA